MTAFWSCIDSNAIETLKAKKGNIDIITILVVQP